VINYKGLVISTLIVSPTYDLNENSDTFYMTQLYTTALPIVLLNAITHMRFFLYLDAINLSKKGQTNAKITNDTKVVDWG
jgi:hypothetical protein